MVKAIATAFVGLGVTIASTFAPSLGLSIHAQRIGFVIGVVLIAVGGLVFLHQMRGASKPPAVEKPAATPASEWKHDDSVVDPAQREAARFKVDTWIRRGEEIEADRMSLPDLDADKATKQQLELQLLLLNQMQATERSAIHDWYHLCIADLRQLGDRVIALFNASESVSYGTFSLQANRKFLADHLTELRAIRARLGVKTLVITSAKWGVPGNEVDVKSRLIDLTDSDGVLDFEVGVESLLSDPAPDEAKKLSVRWRENGHSDGSSFLPGTHVVIPRLRPKT